MPFLDALDIEVNNFSNDFLAIFVAELAANQVAHELKDYLERLSCM